MARNFEQELQAWIDILADVKGECQQLKLEVSVYDDSNVIDFNSRAAQLRHKVKRAM